MDKGASDNKATNEGRAKATINHPLLNKWLTAEIINNLPDETAQAVADLIEAAVRRQKQAVNAHTYYEFYGGEGKVMTEMVDELREILLKEGGVNFDQQKQPEH